MSTLKDIIGRPEIRVDFGVRLVVGKSMKTGKFVSLNHPTKMEIESEDVVITNNKGFRYRLIEASHSIPIISELHLAMKNGGWLPST